MTPPIEGSRLDRRTLNRALLARQHLLDRVELPVADAIEELVGLQAQVPRDPYISLWSRLRGFDPAELERLLLERRAVRMTLMRTTLHLVTAADARVLRGVMQGVCERGFQSSSFRRQLGGIDLDAVLAAATEIVEGLPCTIADLGRALGERWPTQDPNAMAYAFRYLVPLVQVPPRGLLRRSGAARVTTLAAWLGRPAGVPEADAAADAVVVRYLRAFGPATVADMRTWSWLTGLRGAVTRLRPRLRSYRDEAGRELLDVEDGAFVDPNEPAPVRFLGEYDNVFLSHADRSRITGDAAWGVAYARKGAFFVDGFLAGSWSASSAGERSTLAIEPRAGLGGSASEVSAEGEALLGLLFPDVASHAVEIHPG